MSKKAMVFFLALYPITFVHAGGMFSRTPLTPEEQHDKHMEKVTKTQKKEEDKMLEKHVGDYNKTSHDDSEINDINRSRFKIKKAVRSVFEEKGERKPTHTKDDSALLDDHKSYTKTMKTLKPALDAELLEFIGHQKLSKKMNEKIKNMKPKKNR